MDRTSKEIADELGVSPRTIEAHRQNICNKLDLHGSHSLLRFALIIARSCRTHSAAKGFGRSVDSSPQRRNLASRAASLSTYVGTRTCLSVAINRPLLGSHYASGRNMNASSTSLRLLVIEHQAGLRQVVRRWLEGLDCVICECVSPIEALRFSAEPGPDWVVVDAQSKPVNGLVALRELKARFANARFVLVSDVADEALQKSSLQAGALPVCLRKIWEPSGIC